MVLTLVEHDDGVLDDVSGETLTFARGIADEEDGALSAVAVGAESDVAPVAEAAGAFGVETLHAADHERLDAYAPDAWAATLAQLVEEHAPPAVIAPGTDRGNEVIARLASRLELPMAATCVEATVGESYELVRQRWGGSLLEHAKLAATPKLLTVVPHEISAEPVGADPAAVSSFEPTLADDDVAVRVERWEESDVEGVPLPEARVVVGGGRGVGGADGFDQLEELADLLNGTVGSSRAAVNEGWRPHSDQIGQTGAKIAPDLYIPAGISGAVQHWVGAKGAEHVLAINTDPEAAIIQKADFAVIADLHEVVPAVIEEIKKRRGET